MESKCGDVRESKLDNERDDEDEIVQICEGVANVSVVEHENRRQRAVSHFPKEVAQVCKDICTFFDAHEDRPSRARENAVDRVPGPESLRMLLLNAKEDADVWFYEYKLLAPREVNQRQLVAAAAELTPFAENIDGELLCTGADNHHGGVYCVGPEDDDIEGEMEAPSLATYLERYRDTILSGRLEFVEECGMIERCATQEPAKQNQLSSEAGSSSSKKTKNLKGRNKK